LPVQVVAQADRPGVDVLGVAVVVVVATGAGEGAGIGAPAIIVDIGGGRRHILFAIVVGVALFAFDALLALAFRRLRRIELLRGGEIFRRLIVVALKHGIFEQVTLDFLLHFHRRQLQQLDRLLQVAASVPGAAIVLVGVPASSLG
jgi:hypothetical protein